MARTTRPPRSPCRARCFGAIDERDDCNRNDDDHACDVHDDHDACDVINEDIDEDAERGRGGGGGRSAL